MEHNSKIQRSEEWQKIYDIVKQLPIKNESGCDAMDAPSTAAEIEELFLKLLALQNVSGSCFWRHKWGKWKQFKQIMTHIKHGGTFVEMWQQRECKNCGKVQQEHLSG